MAVMLPAYRFLGWCAGAVVLVKTFLYTVFVEGRETITTALLSAAVGIAVCAVGVIDTAISRLGTVIVSPDAGDVVANINAAIVRSRELTISAALMVISVAAYNIAVYLYKHYYGGEA